MDVHPITDVQVEIDVIAHILQVWALRKRAEAEGQPSRVRQHVSLLSSHHFLSYSDELNQENVNGSLVED